ncbi:MAG TPA: glycosyltransferase family 87 protein [Candidatus Sulfotelmatobacter sp.]|nr:glycosyltransferase family 87 protein [Candidatus Sulfotelmatobacter sp.]
MSKRLYFLFGAALAAVAMWLWVQRIAIPHQQTDSAVRGIPRGNLSDLYPRWLGARELLLHHRDPYRSDLTLEIQQGYYGRVLDPSRPNDPKDQQAFAYPLYVVFVLAPTIGFPFAVVQRLFLYFLVALTAASVLLWLRALDWHLSLSSKLIWIVLVLGSFPAIQGFKLQQLTLLVAGLIAISMAAISSGRLVWAAIALAVASIKPQLVFLVVLWLCIWVFGNWCQRRRLFWSMALSAAALVAGAEVLLPGWIQEFRAASAAYYQYTGGGRSVLDVLLSPIAGRVVSAFLVIALLIALWRWRRAPETSSEFQYSLALVLATTLTVIPMFAPYNHLLLIPVLMLIVRAIRDLWAKSAISRGLTAIAVLTVFWPWIAAAGLMIANFFLPRAVVLNAWALPIYTSLAIPITVLALVWVSRNVLLAQKDLLQTPSPRTLRQGAKAE